MPDAPTIQTLLLAAGRGTRMHSTTIKVMHDLLGKPLIAHVIEAALDSGSTRVIPILGHQRDRIEGWLKERPYADKLAIAHQDEQMGTAHAVWSAREYLEADGPDYTAILSGDVPNMDAAALKPFFEATIKSGAAVGLVTAILDDPATYGRVIGDGTRVQAIVEYKDATEEERAIREINAGIYLVRTDFLARALSTIMERPADNAQGEYYLTDLIAIAAQDTDSGGVFGFPVDDPRQIQGVNTRADLAKATAFLKERINHHWMLKGVTFIDPAQTTVEAGVRLQNDVLLYPGVYLSGQTTIARGAVIEPGSFIRDSQIGEDVHIKANCYLDHARIDKKCTVGPFAHLRPGADIGQNCRIGNFVEIKETRMDDGSKASHLSYLGDAHIGQDANVGAGTITCNYDGQKKNRTEIGQGAFIGSNTALVAPVKVGDGAYVGAGSVITADVPDRALGVARGRQRNIEGWADR